MLKQLLQPRKYRPPSTPRPIFIANFHELIKWFIQVEPGEESVTNGTQILYTVPPGRILFIDHISVRGANTTGVDSYSEVRMRDTDNNVMRHYYLGVTKNACNCRSFVIPIAGDYLREGEDIALFSPAANITITGSFHGWEGTRVQ